MSTQRKQKMQYCFVGALCVIIKSQGRARAGDNSRLDTPIDVNRTVKS